MLFCTARLPEGLARSVYLKSVKIGKGTGESWNTANILTPLRATIMAPRCGFYFKALAGLG
jgi:hypothetical protein